jgi:hypothetical protein
MIRDGYALSSRKSDKRNWIAPQAKSVSKVEGDAMRAVKVVLERAQRQPIHELERSRLFRGLPVSDVVSLNFDLAWSEPTQFTNRYRSQAIASEAATRNIREYNRLHSHLSLREGPRVWFPNGSVLPGGPKIRLGLRDFGLQMESFARAFAAFKAWETQVMGGANQATTPEKHAELLRYLEAGHGDRFAAADQWVTRFMLRPVYILGVGLSLDEQGLWWLLVQRARNLARIHAPSQARILLRRGSKEQIEMWNRDPSIVKPIWCDDWDRGWEQVTDMIRNGEPPVLTKAAY